MKALFLIHLLSIFCDSSKSELTNSSDIVVSITGVKNTQGIIFVNLYKTSDGFPKDLSKSIQTIKVNPNVGITNATFKNILNGIYAISVMHDENNNGKMDTNFFGIPIEGYCVSNDAKGFMSAPSFSNASFELISTTTLSIKMIY